MPPAPAKSKEPRAVLLHVCSLLRADAIPWRWDRWEQVMTNWIPIVDSWGSKLLCLIAYTSCTTGEKHSLKPHQPQVVCGAAQVTGERTP
jgi:hypothetical protein